MVYVKIECDQIKQNLKSGGGLLVKKKQIIRK